jgi:hypothetical protein
VLIRTNQTDGGPVAIQSEQILYLRQITPKTVGVVMGARGFNEFAISVDMTLDLLVASLPAHSMIYGIQTGGGPVAVNKRHIRYVRSEDPATIFVLGAKGGEEFALSLDLALDELPLEP